MSSMMTRPIQNAEKLPATRPDRMLSEAPPCLEQLVTSRTCLELVLTNTFVNSGINAPATVPQLMIIDFSMPGTNGAEVVKAARTVQPSLPVLFVSGYADSAALEAAMGTAPFLRKPFRPAELASAVRAALDAGSSSET